MSNKSVNLSQGGSKQAIKSTTQKPVNNSVKKEPQKTIKSGVPIDASDMFK